MSKMKDVSPPLGPGDQCSSPVSDFTFVTVLSDIHVLCHCDSRGR